MFAVVSWPLATEGEELAAVVVQGASLDHISSKFGCLKKKKIELNASRGTSPVVEQRQATQYERFGQILSVQIGKLSARCQKVWKTKHLERGAVRSRRRRVSRGSRPRCIFGPHELRFCVPKGAHDH